jgi:1-acyl-sn-glycerol-3-phosphate acyltransferase
LLRLLTRTTIEGLENIPSEGPVILAGNHAAFLEPVLMTMIPKRLVEPIGAGDLPFEGIIDNLVAWYDFIPFNRGNLDRKGINQALDVLRQGGVIGIFPEGGVWAPGKMPPQIGVALLSQRTGTPVVPIGFSGLKGSLKRALKLKRPELLMKVGKVIPAMKASDGGVDKAQLLAYSRQVLDAIYDLISEEEKDLMPIESRYALSLEFAGEGVPDPLWGSAFARFLHSQVLLDSFKNNLKLPVSALYGQDGRVSKDAMQTALAAVAGYLKVNPAFFTYRFGMEEGNQVAEGIQELQSLLEKAETAGKIVRINTREVVTYKHERLETSEKYFVIEPQNQPG